MHGRKTNLKESRFHTSRLQDVRAEGLCGSTWDERQERCVARRYLQPESLVINVV